MPAIHKATRSAGRSGSPPRKASPWGRSNSTTQPATAGSFLMGIPVRDRGIDSGEDLLLFDIDSVLSTYLGLTCVDGQQDFEIGDRPCGQPGIHFDQIAYVPLSTQTPYSRCVRRSGASQPLGDFTVLEVLDSAVRMRTPFDPGLNYPFDGGIPGEIGLSSLGQQQRYRLSITVTDGTSLPVGVEATFLHQRESIMVFLGALADTDRDGIDDSADPCTDTDGDSLGDPGFPANICPQDNCPRVPNPNQADVDEDGFGMPAIAARPPSILCKWTGTVMGSGMPAIPAWTSIVTAPGSHPTSRPTPARRTTVRASSIRDRPIRIVTGWATLATTAPIGSTPARGTRTVMEWGTRAIRAARRR